MAYRDLEVARDARSDGEVVGARHDLDAVREGALAADVLLEGGGGGAADVDLAVEDDEDEEGGRERGDVRRHHRRLEGTREGPRDVARGVADVGAHARRAAGDIKVERLGHPREHLGEPRGEEEATAG